MKLKLKLALRNIFRHRGRTSVSLLMVTGAVTGLVLFIGFSDYILKGLRNVVIENEYGHIQIADRRLWDLAPGTRKSQLIADPAELIRRIGSEKDVVSISGRLSFFGLVSTGEITVSAKGMGFDPALEKDFTRNLRILEGENLRDGEKFDVILGNGLQKKLNVPVGGSVTVLGYTLDGVVNAMDLTVRGIFNTANGEIDNNVFMVPLSTAQTLVDTDRVEVLSIRVRKTELTDAVRQNIQKISHELSPDYQAKTWFELSTFYRQVNSFYRTQNRVIQIILLSLVFLGILNTVGMSVFERTGEIGTVRALGETDRSVIGQFTLEGMILGLIGSALGAVTGFLTGTFVTSLKLMIDLPGSSSTIPIHINHVPAAYLEAAIIVTLTATAATWIPSIRASKISIVEALKKNV